SSTTCGHASRNRKSPLDGAALIALHCAGPDWPAAVVCARAAPSSTFYVRSWTDRGLAPVVANMNGGSIATTAGAGD
ncbi:MAG: hypothetical protein AAFY64_08640, partial [Pseudomonadota bacterium]